MVGIQKPWRLGLVSFEDKRNEKMKRLLWRFPRRNRGLPFPASASGKSSKESPGMGKMSEWWGWNIERLCRVSERLCRVSVHEFNVYVCAWQREREREREREVPKREISIVFRPRSRFARTLNSDTFSVSLSLPPTLTLSLSFTHTHYLALSLIHFLLERCPIGTSSSFANGCVFSSTSVSRPSTRVILERGGLVLHIYYLGTGLMPLGAYYWCFWVNYP